MLTQYHAHEKMTHGVNGVHIEGTFIFDVENGKISRIRGIFDTRAFFAPSGG